jgi:hypothetical protein
MRLCESCLMQPRCDQSDSIQSALDAQYGFETIKQTQQIHPNACHPGRRPGIQCSPMTFANARSVHGSRIKSGMTLTIKSGLILTICHPGRRPGIQCSSMPFANTHSVQWIPDQVRDDAHNQVRDDTHNQVRVDTHNLSSRAKTRDPVFNDAFCKCPQCAWIPDQVRDDKSEITGMTNLKASSRKRTKDHDKLDLFCHP